MDDGLADQHPVEWIGVERRQPIELEGRLLVEWQGVDVVLRPCAGHEDPRRNREGQPSQPVLQGDLPGRNRAQPELDVTSCNGAPHRRGESWVVHADPQECDGVEERSQSVESRRAADSETPTPLASVGRVSVRPLTPEILWRLRRVGAPVPAPDGSYVIVPVTDHPGDEGTTVLYRVDPGGAAPMPLTTAQRSSSQPAISPDGRTVAFVRKPDGGEHLQLALLPVDGGEARIVTDLPLGAADPRWLPDGSGVLFLGQVLREAPDITATREVLAVRGERKETGKVTEERLYRFWNRWLSDGNVSHIMRYDLATGDVTDLLPGWTSWFDLMEPSGTWDVSPDGSEVVFSAAVTLEREVVGYSLFAAPTDGSGATRRIGERPGNQWQPRYAPDGACIVYGWQETVDYYGEPWKLVRHDIASGAETVLTARWDRSAEQWEFAGEETLVVVAEDDARKHLYRTGLEPSVPEQVVAGGWVSALRTGGDGRAYYSLATLAAPPEAWRVPITGGEPQRLTAFNADVLAEVDLGDVAEIRFPGARGDEIQAFVVYPPGHDPSQPAPLVNQIHGGPHGLFGDQWSYRWNAQTFAAAGYVVVMVNFHGSSSWGADFAESIHGDWATMPAADVEAATDRLVADGVADPERMAIIGGSYGGYLVAWLIGHTDRYQAAVCHAGVVNLLGQYATDGTQGRERAMGAHAWEDIAQVLSVSPTANLEVLETPTLVVHGEKDYRVVVDQGLELYGMLKAKGVPARLLFYPDEGHWILRKPNSLQWYREVLGWLGRHLQ